MENNNYSCVDEKEINLYKYSDIDLVNFIKEKNKSNNNLSDQKSKNKNGFLVELAIFLERKLKNNISLYQNGFKIYKQKLLADKYFMQNTISNDIKNLTINQLIDLLTNIKNNKDLKKSNEFFSIGQYIKNNYNKQNNENELNNSQFSLNNINFELNENENQNNNKKFSNKNKLIHGLNIREIYHSPSPLLNSRKINSKIIEENANINNKIDFYEEQKIDN